MKLNKFNINEFVNEDFRMKCLFLYDSIYIQGMIKRYKDAELNISLYDLVHDRYNELHKSQYKYIKLYAVIE